MLLVTRVLLITAIRMIHVMAIATAQLPEEPRGAALGPIGGKLSNANDPCIMLMYPCLMLLVYRKLSSSMTNRLAKYDGL